MSLDYWAITGIGINANEIRSRIDSKKAALCVRKLLPFSDDQKELADMTAKDDFSAFNIEDFCGGRVFENLADFLYCCSDSDFLTYDDDGVGNSYLYYPPSMPWERIDGDPESEHEVVACIIKAVQKVTDMTACEIRDLIDRDLHIFGYD